MKKLSKETFTLSADEVLSNITFRGEDELDPNDPPGGDYNYIGGGGEDDEDGLKSEQDELRNTQADGFGGNYASTEFQPVSELSSRGLTPNQQVGMMPVASRKLASLRKKLAEFSRKLDGFEGTWEDYVELERTEIALEDACNAISSVIHGIFQTKSPSVSPDGHLGGKGYIQSVKDIRKRLQEAHEHLSDVLDTVSDERNNPVWKKLKQDREAEMENERDEKMSADKQAEEDDEDYVKLGEPYVFDFSGEGKDPYSNSAKVERANVFDGGGADAGFGPSPFANGQGMW